MHPLTLHELVERAADRTPEKVAVRARDACSTYAELDRHASAIAAHLEDLGVGPGDRVAVQQPKSTRTVAALLGIMKRGAAYVPIDPSTPPDRARFVLEHAGAKAFFSGGRPLEAHAKVKTPFTVPLVADDAVEGLAAPRVDRLSEVIASARLHPRRAASDRELAYVLYTSGSTGAPKGVAITHAASLAFVRPAAEVFELGPADVVASHAPFNFDLSVIDLFCTFLAGATMVVVPEPWLGFPARVAKLVAEEGITVWNSVPSALVQLATHGALDKHDLSRLRLVMFAGEPFPMKHLRRLRDLVPRAKLLNVYGQTEANSSTYFEVKDVPEQDEVILPVGRTFPGYEVLVLDEGGRAVTSPGVEGELYVIGGAVASGYFADPERTAQAFVQHPLRRGVPSVVYKTGDRFRYDEGGDLVFLGRMDSAIKIRGYRVELAEVETAAAGHPAVEEAAVVALPSEGAGHVLVLFVTPAGDERIDEAGLRAHLGRKLPRYMLPEVIVSAMALPRTQNGKVDRQRLLEPARRALATPEHAS